MIVKVTVMGALVVFVSVPLILPAPLLVMPVTVTVLSLTQLYTVPATLPVNAIVVIAKPEQIVCDDGVATAFGIGFTTTVAVIGVPVQVTPPFVYAGVIVKVTVTGAVVVFVNEPAILPAPLAAMPVTGTLLSLVQLYTVPATLPVNTIVVMAEPEQMVCDDGVATAFGIGFTTTVAVIDGATQPSGDVAVIVKVTVMGALVVLVSEPLILPVPLFAIPVTVTVLSLTHAKVVPGTWLASTIVVIAEPVQIVCDEGVAVGAGNVKTVAVTGTLGALTQFCPAEYSNSILEMLVVGPNSLHIFCGGFAVSGACVPRRCN